MSDDSHHQTTLARVFSLATRFRELPNDSPAKAVIVTLLVCLFASVMVAGSTVLLRPRHIANKQLEQTRQIAEIVQTAARSGDPWRDIQAGDLEMRVVDLATGNYVDGIDPVKFNQRRMARDPAHNVKIPQDKDLARIKTRAKHAVVHLLQRDGRPAHVR